MAITQRRDRERAQRHRLIVDTARRLAEEHGWPAVTTRRLSELIEYSQPVLYSHFANKDAIVDAVALEGCAELAVALREAAEGHEPAAALLATAQGYLEFARGNPATFDAIFGVATGLTFGPGAAEPQRAAFAALRAVLEPFAGDDDGETVTETGWSAIHGLAVLERHGRLRPEHSRERLRVLVDRFVAGAGDSPSD